MNVGEQLLCATSAFSVSPWLMVFLLRPTTETQRTQRLHREIHFQWSRYSAETTSMNKCAFGCVRRIDAGQAVLIGPSIVFFIAWRFAGPGAMANSFGRAISVGIVSDNASFGTSVSEAKAPSLTCWFRQTSSSWTTFT